MKNFIRGFFFWAMWYLSIMVGFFIFICPILPLVIISPKKYRKWSDRVFGLWEPFPVAVMEICLGVRVVLSGDKINPFEGSLFVMNHRTRVDWNFLWLGLFHCCQPNAHNMKYILKSPLMHVPGPGWVMQTCSFIFVYRKWCRDKPLLNNIIEYLNASDSLYQILIFPEGTDLTAGNIEKSHKYAEENNLQKYSRVLHPRTTGFTFIATKMKSGGQLKAIYDVTVAYPKTTPQTEIDLLRGRFPEEVHFNVKRYSSSNIPCGEEALNTWLSTVWREKEEKLQRFYTTGCFTGEGDGPLYNLENENLDFRQMSIQDGVIKYEGSSTTRPKEKSLVSIKREESSRRSVKSNISRIPEESTADVKSKEESLVRVKSEPKSEKSAASVRSEGSGAKSPVKSGSVTESRSSGSRSPVKSGSVEKNASNAEAAESKGDVEKPTAEELPEAGTSKDESKPATETESENFARNHVNCEDVYRSKHYRPSHLLYLALAFWFTLIILMVHQLYYNFYLQIWVLTHSLLFAALSLLSNGFHHIAASIYFYRHGRSSCLNEKRE